MYRYDMLGRKCNQVQLSSNVAIIIFNGSIYLNPSPTNADCMANRVRLPAVISPVATNFPPTYNTAMREMLVERPMKLMKAPWPKLLWCVTGVCVMNRL